MCRQGDVSIRWKPPGHLFRCLSPSVHKPARAITPRRAPPVPAGLCTQAPPDPARSSPAALRTHHLLQWVAPGAAGGLRGRPTRSRVTVGRVRPLPPRERGKRGKRAELPRHYRGFAALQSDPGSGRARDPAEAPRPAEDAVGRSQ